MSSSDQKNELLEKQNQLLQLEVQNLKNDLENKNQQLAFYQKELIRFSDNLDQVMAQISQDVDMLKKIQLALLPTELPKFQGFKISRKFVYGSQFGGDYFDLFEHDDKFKFSFLLSSSTGYSMSALFLSLMIKMSHMVEAKKGLDPAKFLELIADEIKAEVSENKTMNQTKVAVQETSVVYGVVDRRDLSFEFCLVGDIKAFFVSPQKVVKLLSSDSVGLNYAGGAQFKNCRLELDSQSRLLFVSKGILEVLSTDDISELLIQFAQNETHDIRNEIFVRAQQKSGLEMPLRDQTVVVIDVKDRVIKLAK